MKRCIKSAEECNGIFWVIDNELFAYPFYDTANIGVAKSGGTYNHKKLWSEIAPQKYRNKPFDYYPRGRVEFKSTGQPIIYMNPNIDEDMINEIKRQFGLRSEPIIHIDNSEHYKCHLDEGYNTSHLSQRNKHKYH